MCRARWEVWACQCCAAQGCLANKPKTTPSRVDVMRAALLSEAQVCVRAVRVHQGSRQCVSMVCGL